VTLLLGIDVGTSATKGVLVTWDGDVVGRASRSHRVDMPRPGWFEQDPETWWVEIVAIARELIGAVPTAEIGAVCVSGMGPCTVLADGAGRPLRPAILYGVDTRATTEIGELNDELGREAILAVAGSPLSSQSVGPKLRWLARHEPESVAAARMLLMPSSLAVHRLTGAYVLDHHSASQCQPLYDLRAGDWHEAWATAVAPGLPLPSLQWPAEAVGVVTSEAAAETGIPQGTPVATGTIDAWAEAISVGVRRPGDLMLMYGTTMFIVDVVAEARPDQRLWLTRWVVPDGFSRAAGLATAGALTDWFSRLVGASHAELAAEAAATEPGAGGLVILPYFAGERTPLFDPLARGVACGLHLGHGRGHLYRSLLESTAFAVRHNLEAMSDAGDPVTRIVAVGGGAQNDVWTQVVSDVTGLAQDVPRETVGAAYGDAFMAAVAIGAASADSSWTVIEHAVEPAASAGATYGELYGIYRKLYAQTRASAHRLADFQQAAAAATGTR
jgi:xylulokinase